MPRPSDRPVLELRVALTTPDFERLLGFYADGLGVEPSAFWQNDGGRAAMLDLGRASLEVFDEAQAAAIDRLEAGHRVSGAIRFAMRVPHLDAAVERLLAHGATLVQAPVLTPWAIEMPVSRTPTACSSRCSRNQPNTNLLCDGEWP